MRCFLSTTDAQQQGQRHLLRVVARSQNGAGVRVVLWTRGYTIDKQGKLAGIPNRTPGFGCRADDLEAMNEGTDPREQGSRAMTKHKAATAGERKPSSTAPQTPAPLTVPRTTTKDAEQNTYTLERSKQLRDGNFAAR